MFDAGEPLQGRPVVDDAVWLQVSAAIYLPLTLLSAGWVVWEAGWYAMADRFVGEDPLWWLALGLGGGALIAGISQRTSEVGGLGRMADALAAQLGPMGPAVSLGLAALSSVGEEWCFRGVLQPAWGWLPATALFALVHLPIERDLWPWPLLAGAIGLVLAAIFELSGGLVGPIALHFALNALNLRWLARRAVRLRREGPGGLA